MATNLSTSHGILKREYYPGLDGLRGLAILLVMLYHFFLGWPYWDNFFLIALGHVFGSFWVGVDIFFVLSGFLITQILIDTADDEHRWLNFMSRRVLRIFPLYYLVMFFVFFIFPYLDGFKFLDSLVLPVEMSSLYLWYFSYTSNYLMSLFPADYPIYLSITWSLAVEEQFYLVWPWLIWYFKNKNLTRFFIGAFIFAQIAKVICYLVFSNHLTMSYFVFCRVDLFAMGAFLASLEAKKALDIRFEKSIFWMIFLGLGLFYLLLIPNFYHPLLYALIGPFATGVWTGGCILLTTVPNRLTFIRDLFNFKILKSFGKYSYCMYLIHAFFLSKFSLLAIQTTSFSADLPKILIMLIIYFILVFCLSKIIYHVIEKPFLRLKKYFV